MLISHSHSLLFVHIQKTAGTSLTAYLKANIPDLQDFLRPHDPLKFAQQSLGQQFDQYVKVGFVRNPFARLVSWYSMITELGTRLSEEEKRSDPNYNRIWQHVLTHSNSFEEFVLNCSDATDRSGWKPFLFNQVDYLKLDNGDVGADFIGRFEYLADDMAQLCDLIGIAKTAIPHINKSTHADYRRYYSEETRDIVERRFAEDLARFNYQF